MWLVFEIDPSNRKSYSASLPARMYIQFDIIKAVANYT